MDDPKSRSAAPVGQFVSGTVHGVYGRPDDGIGVVIPTLNRPDLLRRCLQSILRGNVLPATVVVCDQSTSPAAGEMVRSIRAEFPGVHVQHLQLPHPHASAARNAGFHAANRPLVAFIDDDCEAHPGWLEALVRAYSEVSPEQPLAAVAGRVLPMQSAASSGLHAVSARTGTNRRFYRRPSSRRPRGKWAPWDIGTGANILVSRSAFEQVGGFDLRLGPGTPARAAEDIDLLYRLGSAGTIMYEPAAIVYHPMKSLRAHLASRAVYGGGMATMLARHMASGDSAAQALLLLYVRHQLANVTRKGVWGPIEVMLTLAGVVRAVAKVWLDTGSER